MKPIYFPGGGGPLIKRGLLKIKRRSGSTRKNHQVSITFRTSGFFFCDNPFAFSNLTEDKQGHKNAGDSVAAGTVLSDDDSIFFYFLDSVDKTLYIVELSVKDDGDDNDTPINGH